MSVDIPSTSVAFFTYIFLELVVRHAGAANPVCNDSSSACSRVSHFMQDSEILWCVELFCCIRNKHIGKVMVFTMLCNPARVSSNFESSKLPTYHSSTLVILAGPPSRKKQRYRGRNTRSAMGFAWFGTMPLGLFVSSIFFATLGYPKYL
jgi:hypothetical protein